MNEREELQALRRLAELEAKRRGQTATDFMRGIDPQLQASGRLAAERVSLGEELTAGMGPGGRLAAGVGRGMTSVVRALGGGRVAGALGLPATQAEAQAVDAPLMQTQEGNIGSVVGVAAPAALAVPFTPATIPGAMAAGGLTGAAMTEGGLQERAISGGLGMAGGAVGQYGANMLTRGRDQLRTIAGQQAQRAAARQPAVQAAMQAGYVLPPNEIRGDLFNALTNAWSGQIKTKQAASFQNQQNTNRLAALALGLPADQPLSTQAVQGVRSGAAGAYDNLRNSGAIIADPQFQADLAALNSRQANASAMFPGLANDALDNLRTSLDQPFFDASAGVDAMALLRERADDAFSKGDKSLGKAFKQASNALESLVERNLQATDPDALKEFRKARQLMAKTYDVEGALNPATGDVSAATLATKAKKKPGRFTGELKQIADAGMSFPGATQTLKEAPSPYSMVDVGFGTAAGFGISPYMAALSAARPVVRTMMLSGPGQRVAAANLLPTPANALERLLTPAVTARRALVPIAASGAMAYGPGQ